MFASTIGATDCAKFMHRVEGLTWGPKLLGQHQQLLYATGYTGSAGAPPPVNDVVRTHLGKDSSPSPYLTLIPLAPGTEQAAALPCSTAAGRHQPS